MSSQSGKLPLKLENVALWYKCKECNRYFHAFPFLESHFFQEHHDKEFIVPKNLPPEAREGRVYMKKQKQQFEIYKDPLQSVENYIPLQQDPANLLEVGRNVELNCTICYKSFKSESVLNFHLKKQHGNVNSDSDDDEMINGIKSDSSTTSSNNDQKSSLLNTSADITQSILSAKIRTKVSISSPKNLQEQNEVHRKVTQNPDNFVHFRNRKYNRCPKCPYFTIHGFTSVRFLAHLKLHDKNCSKAVICSYCGAYISRSGMVKHVTNIHPNAVHQNNMSVDQEAATLSNLGRKTEMTRKTCEERFENGSVLNFHLKKEHGKANSDSDDKKMNNEMESPRINSTSEKNHQLTPINSAGDSVRHSSRTKIKTKVSSLLARNIHKKTQNGVSRNFTVKPYFTMGRKYHKCPKCTYYTKKKAQSLVHAKLHNKNSGAIKCHYCGAYIGKQGMGMHVKKMHPGAILKKYNVLEKSGKI